MLRPLPRRQVCRSSEVPGPPGGMEEGQEASSSREEEVFSMLRDRWR